MSVKELAESAASLDAMADYAATLYYDNAVKYGICGYPKKGVRKSRNWNRFVQIARICMAHNVPVDKFVNTAFVSVMERHPLVTVNDICSFDYRNVNQERKSDETISPQDLWNLLSCKLLDIVFAVDGVKSKIDILDNPMYGFPAWFRVFSPEYPIEQLLVHWGDLAFEEINGNVKLSFYLKEKRPEICKLLKSVMDKI